MIEEAGQVVRQEGDFAWVAVRRQAGCSSCSAQSGCGTASLSRWFGRKSHEVRARNPINARPGEDVVVGISESALVKTALRLYLMPLLALLAGGLIGESLAAAWGGGDGVVALSALGAFTATLWWLRRRMAHLASVDEYQAVILRRQGSPSVVVFHSG